VSYQVSRGSYGSHTPHGPTQSTGIGGMIVGAIGLGAIGVSVWGLVCAARITFSALSLLIDIITDGGPSGLVRVVVLNGVAGVLAAAAVAILRSWPRKTGRLSESFVSALFNKGLAAPGLDGVFIGRVILGTIVGFLVGAANGASGFINFPQFVSETHGAEVFRSTVYPIAAFLGGGFGGPGGTDVWSLLFLVIVIILAALLVGLLAGFLLNVVLAGVGGTVKGGTKAYITKILTERTKGERTQEPHPILAGMRQGLLIGLIIGILESIFTILGVVRFVAQR
jgi:hypothetical protein